MELGSTILSQEVIDNIMLWVRLMEPPDSNTHRQRLQAVNCELSRLFPKWDNDKITHNPNHRWGTRQV